MTGQDVLAIIDIFQDLEIEVWIDGGWCMDAHIGRQTRKHDDLDIVLDQKDVQQAVEELAALGYRETGRDSEWNFVMEKCGSMRIDFHAFIRDKSGKITGGVPYPDDSLNGRGTIGGRDVNCVSREYLMPFRTGYPVRDKDRQDVRILHNELGLPLPDGFRKDDIDTAAGDIRMKRTPALFSKDNRATLEAGPGTDFFIDNRTGYRMGNAPFRFIEVEGDFICRVRIEPEFRATYDAGTLMAFLDGNRWIKAAFEMTDLGYPAMVTVVTDGTSDDANGKAVTETALFIQLVREDNYWAIHSSPDGVQWEMVRYFEMPGPRQIRVGISTQSPAGDGCRVNFSSLSLRKGRCADLRKGE